MYGCVFIKTNIKNKKINDKFLIKLSTAISHLVGIANFDSMSQKFYARFDVNTKIIATLIYVKHILTWIFHTHGTYVKEKTDWLLMTKVDEINAEGGEAVLLHLDDWEHINELSKDPIGRQNFIWGSQKVKI